MSKIILPRSEQKRILAQIKESVIHQLSGRLDTIKEIRLFGSIIRWEFGKIPEGKKTSSGTRYWSDIDFLIIAKQGFKPLPQWKVKFETNHGYWFCYYLPKGIPVEIFFEGKNQHLDVAVGIAVIFEDTLKDKAKLERSNADGLPLKKSIWKKTYKRIY